MKIRNGFVSNSSSSSFIVILKDNDNEKYEFSAGSADEWACACIKAAMQNHSSFHYMLDIVGYDASISEINDYFHNSFGISPKSFLDAMVSLGVYFDFESEYANGECIIGNEQGKRIAYIVLENDMFDKDGLNKKYDYVEHQNFI